MSLSCEAGEATRRQAPSPPLLRITLRKLLTAFLFLGALFSFVIPPFEAPDEVWHYAFVQHLVTQQALPVSAPNTQALWRQQGTQGPAYYAGAALLTALIDQSDFPEIYARANPHRAIGEPDASINRNYLIHHGPAERFPWRGSILALHVARLFSVFLGAVTVYAVYRTLHLLLPPQDALLGAAFAAFLPQFVFISGTVNNDNALNAAAALVLWQLTAMLVEGGRPRRARLLKLGVLLGLALLSKLSGLGILGVVGLAVLWLAWRSRSLRPVFDATLWTAAPALLVAGWWYLRNWQLYRDPLAWAVWEANILLRVIPAGASQILGEMGSLERSFWGLFGWLNLPFPPWVYLALRVVATLVAIGLLAQGVRCARRRKMFASFMPHALLFTWLLFLTISWLRFMRVAPAAQGRYFFAAMPALALLWALGWAGWNRFGRRAGGFVTAALGLLTLVTPFALIRPAYSPPPMPVADQERIPLMSAEPLAIFGESSSRIRLWRATTSAETVLPGGDVQVELAYDGNDAAAVDWSLFLHLVDESGLIVAQLDTMPGGGLRPTSGWQGGVLFDNYTVTIPISAFTPNLARWRLGFYNHRTGARLLRSDGSYDYAFGDLRIPSSGDSPDLPVPLRVRFAGNVTLTGYRFSSQLPVPGEEMTVTLFWTASGQVVESYTMFAHLLTAGFEMYGGADLMPEPPTESWSVGQTVQTIHTFTVPPEAPGGLYQVEVGLYTRPDFLRQRVLDRINPAQEDRLLLGPLRIR